MPTARCGRARAAPQRSPLPSRRGAGFPPSTCGLFHADASSGAAVERVAERVEVRDQRAAAECESGLDLRPHRALGQTRKQRLRLVPPERPQLALIRAPEVLVHGGNLGEDDELARTELAG